MPTNKNALTRYKFLDELLSDRHHYFDIHDLTDRVNEKLVTAGLQEDAIASNLRKGDKFTKLKSFGMNCNSYAG